MLRNIAKLLPILTLSILLLTSCEEELSTRELMEEQLKEVISDNEIRWLWVYLPRDYHSSDTWTFNEGFLILDNTHHYDLDKLISYEISQSRLTLHFN